MLAWVEEGRLRGGADVCVASADVCPVAVAYNVLVPSVNY